MRISDWSSDVCSSDLLDDHKHGDADLDDVVAAKKMLADTGYVDPDKVVIQGQRYGGYMTLAGLALRSDAFAAGVDIYGVANWPRLLANKPSWGAEDRRVGKASVSRVSSRRAREE